MKILLDTHMLGRKQTGTERYWKNLYEAFSSYNKNDLRVYKYSHKLNNGLYRIFLGFNQAVKAINPDIIHVQNFAPFVKTIPIVNTVHDLCFKSYPQLFGSKTNLAFKHFFRRSLDLSDAIICVSNYTREQLLKFYQVDPKKVFVVYEAADECFRYIESKKTLKIKLKEKFSIKNNYFLVVGNIEKRKLPHKVIESFGEIFKKYKDVDLVFVGPNKLGIKPTKNIKILGYVTDEELNLLYNGATALIYLSLCEGFGLPLVEAMAVRIPIVCSNIPVFRETVGDGNAFFVDNDKINELVSVLDLLLSNEGLREKYSSLSYNRSKFFSWEKTAKETFEVYQYVLSRK